MSDFLFYLTPVEVRELVSSLLARGYRLLTKIPFPVGNAPEIIGSLPGRPIEELFPNLSVLVFGPFSTHAPVIRILPNGKLARYSDNQGGPMIALHLPGCWPTADGYTEYAPGMITVQAKFWDQDLARKIGPTPELKLHHSQLLRDLKSKLIQVDNSWISGKVIADARNGLARFRPKQFEKKVLAHMKTDSTESGSDVSRDE